MTARETPKGMLSSLSSGLSIEKMKPNRKLVIGFCIHSLSGFGDVSRGFSQPPRRLASQIGGNSKVLK